MCILGSYNILSAKDVFGFVDKKNDLLNKYLAGLFGVHSFLN